MTSAIPVLGASFLRSRSYAFSHASLIRKQAFLKPFLIGSAGCLPRRSLFMDSNHVTFRQLFDTTSSTYTYIIGDNVTKEAIIIDPVVEKVDRDSQLLEEMGLKLKYAANTHVHADHITGTGELKKKISGCTSVISKASAAVADKHLEPGDIVQVGSQEIEVRATPGHTDGCLTYVWHSAKKAFTGDALLIRGCGRTDFQQGSPERLYESVHSQIFSLPDDYLLYPAHDYKGQTVTSVKEEKLYNARLTKSKEEFVNIMNNLNLAYPKLIDKAVPANMVCGYHDTN